MSLDQTTMSRRKCGMIDIDSELTAGGFTLYAGQTAGGRVDLIDIRGEKVHEWNMPVRPGRDAVILPMGILVIMEVTRSPQIFILLGIFGMVDISWKQTPMEK